MAETFFVAKPIRVPNFEDRLELEPERLHLQPQDEIRVEGVLLKSRIFFAISQSALLLPCFSPQMAWLRLFWFFATIFFAIIFFATTFYCGSRNWTHACRVASSQATFIQDALPTELLRPRHKTRTLLFKQRRFHNWYQANITKPRSETSGLRGLKWKPWWLWRETRYEQPLRQGSGAHALWLRGRGFENHSVLSFFSHPFFGFCTFLFKQFHWTAR